MSKEEKALKKNESDQSISFAIGELAFIILPFVVMTITFNFNGNIIEIIKQPEWSLAASVMFGQSIIRMLHAVARGSREIYHYRVGAFFALIILFGLVPSLTTLSLIFTGDDTPTWLIWLQLTLFVLSAFIFFVVNALHASSENDD